MEKIKQNTSAWEEERLKRIGASESPIIMGISKYSTRLELFKEKTGQVVKEYKGNFITDKGHRKEPIARGKFEFQCGKSYPDALGVHKDYPFIGASFDGLNPNDGDHIEIKFVGKKQFDSINDIKSFRKEYEHYYCQMQHQSFITGKDGTLVMINDDDQIKSLPVPIDIPYIENMVPHLIEFWNQVQTKTEPEKTKDDVLELPKDKAELMARYSTLIEIQKELEAKIEDTKFLLLDGLEKCGYEHGKAKILYVERIGSVEYKDIPELKNVNLDKYRKPSTASFTIKL